MKLPWAAWALVAAIGLIGVQPASAQGLEDLFAAFGSCPEPVPCNCLPPMEHEFGLIQDPESPQWEARVKVRGGWSPTTMARCTHVTSWNLDRETGLVSETPREHGIPPDCIPVPEPPAMLAIGLGWLAWVGRRVRPAADLSGEGATTEPHNR